MWDNVCRLCSSRGDYDIFSIIPSYLHASSNEFLLWQKPIYKLLEETTGLAIEENDGLPHRMCALCISYLKHAATFRQQAINNAVSLKAVSTLSGNMKKAMHNRAENIDNSNNEKANVLITIKDLNFSDERKTDTNKLVNILNNQSSKINKSDECMKKLLLENDSKENKCNIKENYKASGVGIIPEDGNEDDLAMTYLNLLFDKDTNGSARKIKRLAQQPHHRRLPGDNKLAAIFDDMNNITSDPLGEEFQTASSDENEAFEQKKNFFSYREKNFEEDDVMDLDELKEANITINIPETCKERKCRACFRRFMFEESYKEHMDVCIEYKFLLFIEEINRLLDIRRSKAVSPHEFIRRMIFCLRKTCHWLKSSCGEILLPDLLVNGETKKRLESDGKNSTAEISSGGNSDEITEKFAQKANKVVERKKSLLDILKQDAESLLVPEGSLDTSSIKQDGKFTKRTEEPNISKSNKSLLHEMIDKNKTTITSPKFENILTLIDGQTICEIQPNCSILLPKRNEMEMKNFPKSSDMPMEERSNFLEKLKNASISSLHKAPQRNTSMHGNSIPFQRMYSNMKFSARCNTCNTVFESVASLEEHNANFHNNHVEKAHDERTKIISLFEEDNATES